MSKLEEKELKSLQENQGKINQVLFIGPILQQMILKNLYQQVQ